MSKASTPDPRLARVERLCLRLPEVGMQQRGDHAGFRVRTRIFACFLNDHHGDGIVAVCCKSENGENVDRALREPARFYLPAYIGKRGWFGLRLDRGRIDWKEVANLLELSYCLVAPKALVKHGANGKRPDRAPPKRRRSA